MAFQTQVSITPAIAVSGDFATANPRASYPAGEAGLIAGTGGVTVGTFAWVRTLDGVTVLNAGTGAPQGFIQRRNQAAITEFLTEISNTIPAGSPITLMTSGDYYVTCLNASAVGQKAFASVTTGAVQAGAAGATISGYVETDFKITRACGAGELTIISK